MALQNVHTPIPGTGDSVPLHMQWGLCRGGTIMDIKMGRLSWMITGPLQT